MCHYYATVPCGPNLSRNMPQRVLHGCHLHMCTYALGVGCTLGDDACTLGGAKDALKMSAGWTKIECGWKPPCTPECMPVLVIQLLLRLIRVQPHIR